MFSCGKVEPHGGIPIVIVGVHPPTGSGYSGVALYQRYMVDEQLGDGDEPDMV